MRVEGAQNDQHGHFHLLTDCNRTHQQELNLGHFIAICCAGQGGSCRRAAREATGTFANCNVPATRLQVDPREFSTRSVCPKNCNGNNNPDQEKQRCSSYFRLHPVEAAAGGVPRPHLGSELPVIRRKHTGQQQKHCWTRLCLDSSLNLV